MHSVILHYCYAWQQKDKRSDKRPDSHEMSAQQLEQEQEADDIAYDVYGEEAPTNPGPKEDGEKHEEENGSEGEPAKEDG